MASLSPSSNETLEEKSTFMQGAGEGDAKAKQNGQALTLRSAAGKKENAVCYC